MRSLIVLCLYVSVTFTGLSIAAVHQEDDVRGAFLVSRPKEKPQRTSTSRPSRRRPRPSSVAKDPKNTGATPTETSTTEPATGTKETKPRPVNTQRLGIGLTLFMRDTNGLAVRTDPSHVFKKGDSVRVLLETNADGYLYIFNTTNNGTPVMLYPNAELDEAGNYLQAHVPFEVPASANAEERLRWLVFDDNPGDERLYFIFTREPLGGVPIEDELINFCRDNKSCIWKPTDEVWAQIQRDMSHPLKTDKATQFGSPQTQGEQQATSRGLGLAKDDPPPSLIMMASTDSSTLVTTLDLIHK